MEYSQINNLISKFIKITLIFVLLLFFININAQKPKYLFEEINEKFPNSSMIYSMFQDQDGFLWFSTFSGLYKYDGYSFLKVEHDVNDTTSLPNNAVYLAFENKKGEIWVAGAGYISLLNKTDYSFTHFWNNRGNNKEVDLFYTKNNKENIWLISTDGVLKFNTISREIKSYRIKLPKNKQMGNKPFFFIDKKNQFWLSSKGKLFFCKNINNQTLLFSDFTINSTYDSLRINHIYEDNKNTYWLSTNKGVFQKKKSDTSFMQNSNGSELNFLNENVIFINNDSEDNLWIKTTENIYIYSPSTKYLEKIENRYFNNIPVYQFNNDFFLHDSSNCHWTKTDKGKLLKYREIKNSFVNIKHYFGNKKPITKGSVFSIYDNYQGMLWIGTTKGIYLYNKENKQINRFIYSQNGESRVCNKDILSINRDKNDNLWIGTRHNGLYKLVKNKKELIHFKKDITGRFFLQTNDMYRFTFSDTHKRTWFARVNGVSRLTEDGAHFKNFELFPVKDQFNQHHIFDIIEDKKGDIWVGGSYKFFQINSLNDSILDFDIGVINHNIFGLHYHRGKDLLYIGTQAEGLIVFDIYNYSIVKIYTKKDGLPSNTIYCFLEDDSENIWMSTGKGISKFNPYEQSFINYGKKDGLEFDDFSSGAHFKNSNGEMFFGGEYVVKFHPDSIKPAFEKYQPSLKISAIKVLGTNKKFDLPPSKLKEIELNADDSYFEIYFSSLDYRFPDKREYKYKLEGFDKDWVEAGKRNFATYANLDVGTYNFKVRATNSDGYRLPKELSVKLVVEANNFTQEIWFKPILLLIFVGSIISLVLLILKNKQKIREEKIIKEKKLLEHEVQMTGLQALRSQMNPHFLYNVLNSVNSFISKNDKLTANKFLADFGKLMRYILNNSKEHLTLLSSELGFLRLYLNFEQLRFGEKFNYEMFIDKNININEIKIPTMLIQPLLENSIKHGLRQAKRNGYLQLKIISKNNKIIISISDNGMGINKSKELNKNLKDKFNSTGINNIRERISILNKLYNKNIKLKIQDKQYIEGLSEGTLVNIIFDNPTEWIMN